MFRDADRDEWERPNAVGTDLLEEHEDEELSPEPDDPEQAEEVGEDSKQVDGALGTRADGRRKADDEDFEEDFDDEEEEFEDEDEDLEDEFDDDFDENEDVDEDLDEDVEEEEL